MPIPAYQPTEVDLPRLVEALSSPDLSLSEIAEDFGITLDALSLYLTTPEALLHIANIELATALRIRLAAQSHLPRAINALNIMLQGYAIDTDKIPIRYTEGSIPLREQQRQNARRAANLLYRFSHFTPRPIAGIRATVCEPLANRADQLQSSNSSLAPRESRLDAVRRTGGEAFPSYSSANSQAPAASNPTPAHGSQNGSVSAPMSTVHCPVSTVTPRADQPQAPTAHSPRAPSDLAPAHPSLNGTNSAPISTVHFPLSTVAVSTRATTPATNGHASHPTGPRAPSPLTSSPAHALAAPRARSP